MATTINKKKLSGSTSGKPIKVAATSTPGTAIHTATTSASEVAAGIYDEVFLFASNNSAAAATLTIEYGGTTSPDDLICKDVVIPANSGPVPVCPGLILQNTLLIKAFAGTANVICISGFVNRVTNDA